MGEKIFFSSEYRMDKNLKNIKTVTGIDNNKLGLVYISCCINNKCFVKKINFKGNRKEIIEQSSNSAIDFTIKKLKSISK